MFLLAAACSGSPRASGQVSQDVDAADQPPDGLTTEAVVRPGIEVLLADSAHLVRGRRAALVSHAAGVDRHGVRSVDRLVAAGGVNLVALFSPEHGFHGVLDQPDVPDEQDPATGLPIYSLYRLSGPARDRFPTLLDALEVLLVDLQDIGARPYTYAALLAELLAAARSAGVHVVVLDRPNPIGGVLVQGPLRDSSLVSFVSRLAVPLRHGLTMGELALLANEGLGTRVTIVPAAGWRRAMWFDETGLPWVNPSPNMPGLESATHYPGTVLFEATNLSVGRGTPRAFQQVGASWLDTAAVLASFRAVGMPGVAIAGVRFAPVSPTDRKYDGELIAGVRLRVTARRQYDPVLAATALLVAVHRAHPTELLIDAQALDRRAGTSELREGIESGATALEIAAGWAAPARRFLELRGPVLLYR